MRALSLVAAPDSVPIGWSALEHDPVDAERGDALALAPPQESSASA
jgi:hypothetical protein